MSPSTQTLLLNWIYYHPVGHAVEALAIAADFAAGDPNVEIHLLLNRYTPTELADLCPWIKKTYAIDADDVRVNGKNAVCLADLPREWDFIVYSHRMTDYRKSYTPAMLRCHEVLDEITTARRWRGHEGEVGPNSAGAPKTILFSPFRLSVPSQSRSWADQFSGHKLLCAVLLGGSSSESIYPSISWWTRLFEALTREFPGIHFLVTGTTDHSQGRTMTPGYSSEELQSLFQRIPNASNCYDVGLSHQLALLERANVFVSPHTGFAFLAPCVGTPWLAISGTRWPDPTYARVPFYAVLPQCPHYPCFDNMLPECGDRLAKGERPRCMQEGLEEVIPDVLHGFRRLLDPHFDITVAVAAYEEAALRKGICMDRLYTLGVLKHYLRD